MSVATLANRTYTFERPAITHDAIGGQVKTFSTSLVVAGRVQPISGRDRIARGREEEDISHLGYFAGTPDIVAGDRCASPTGGYLYVLAARNIDHSDVFLTLEMQERDT